ENAHSVADSIAGRIESEMKQAKVMIHIEPCAVPCAEECADHCKKPAK
ncbi:MAG: cation transporter, partial [Elusimicrobia bacterium]|nr:cation transporter [Elusimicrobiota bacterium]